MVLELPAAESPQFLYKCSSQDPLQTFEICISGDRSLGSAFLANPLSSSASGHRTSCAHVHTCPFSAPGRAAVAWTDLLTFQVFGSQTTKISALPSSMTASACSLISHPRVVHLYAKRIFGGNHTFTVKYHLKREVTSPWKQVSKAHPFMKRIGGENNSIFFSAVLATHVCWWLQMWPVRSLREGMLLPQLLLSCFSLNVTPGSGGAVSVPLSAT